MHSGWCMGTFGSKQLVDWMSSEGGIAARVVNRAVSKLSFELLILGGICCAHSLLAAFLLPCRTVAFTGTAAHRSCAARYPLR